MSSGYYSNDYQRSSHNRDRSSSRDRGDYYRDYNRNDSRDYSRDYNRNESRDYGRDYNRSNSRDYNREERRDSRRDNNFNERNRNEYKRKDDMKNDKKYNNLDSKNLEPVDYDLEKLESFQKNFYVESPITTQRTQEEVNEYLRQNEIQIQGSEEIKCLLNFEECNFPDSIKRVIEEQKYEKPTPIQAVGWPIVLQGKDVVGIAETGSGKTISFLIPGIIHLLSMPLAKYREGPRVLILAPTRELVYQIYEESIKFTKGTNIKTAVCFGGVPQQPQMREFQSGCDICIATPGRLIDFIKRNVTSLNRTTFLVIDEADRMLDMGFEQQVRDIIGQIRPDRQTVMWTATWPQTIQNFALGFMFHPLQINIGNPILHANNNVKQIVRIIEERDRDDRMSEILEELGSEKKVLIFVLTKRSADDLCYKLKSRNYKAGCMHGDKSQVERDRVLSDFKKGFINYLVATDVAARGLDIKDIEAVINYEMPQEIESYIHRIGRTGRMGRSVEGVAISLFTKRDARLARDLIAILSDAQQEIPQRLYDFRF